MVKKKGTALSKKKERKRALSKTKERKGTALQVEEIKEDGILTCILSSLSMRDAVRTSILSSRWRYLWTYIPNLYFDDFNMFGEYTVSYTKSVSELSLQDQKTFWEDCADEFISCVNEFLRYHQGVGVQAFSVVFFLHKKHADHLDRWTSFAIESGAKDLTLDLQKQHCQTTKPYDFPSQLFAGGRRSFVECIRLVSCSLSVPINFDGFNSLKALYLTKVNVNDRDIQNLLSSSLALESLSVNSSNELVYLNISHPSGRLKYLEVAWCHHLKKIDFFAVNLITFEYHGHRPCLTWRNAPRPTSVFIHIEEIDVAVDYLFTGLPKDVPHLETLLFHIDQYDEVVNFPVSSQKFTHLKHLVIFVLGGLPTDLLWLTSLLAAAPFVEKFELHLHFCGNPCKERKVIRRLKCPHNHLKTVEISGFNGSMSSIEMAIFMLNNAPALELMTIFASKKYYEGNNNWAFAGDTWTEQLRLLSSEFLHKEVPLGAKLALT